MTRSSWTRYLVVAALILLVGAVWSLAGEEEKLKIEVKNIDGQEITVDVNGVKETIHLDDLAPGEEREFKVGEHPIVISEPVEDGEEARIFCETTLIVQDTLDPEPVEEPVELWPPNHKWHTITGADCVKDLCDGDDLQVTFSYATSDEPVNDKGDGNTEPDIILECDRVQLRAERQGPSNGRVYKLGYKAVDDSGKTVEDVCTVVVPHDQSGREAIDDGPAYTLELDDDECDDGTGGAGGEGGSGGAGGDDGEGGSGGSGGDGGVIVP